MASTLEEQLGVATGGAHWDVGGFRLWQSTVPDLLFYAPLELRIAAETSGRYRAGLTDMQRFRDGAYTTVRGSIVLGVCADPSEGDLRGLADEWRRVLVNTGYTASPRPRFLPLPSRDIKTSAVLDASLVDDARDAGAPRDGRTFIANLTAAGARAFAQAIRRQGEFKSTIRVSYEYPQLLPRSVAAVSIVGARAYALAAERLRKGPDDALLGAAREIDDLWTAFLRGGAIRVTLVEGADTETDRAALLARLTEQARQQLFDTLFERHPSGSMAFRWRHPSAAVDFAITISVEGWTWLKTNLDADLARLLGTLDESYINTTYESVSVPVSVVVEPSPLVTSVALSLDFGAAHSAEAPLFDAAGGTRQFTVSSDRPDTITVAHRAKVNFAPANWPVIEAGGSNRLGNGCRIELRPHAWIRRHTMYLYVRRGNRIVPQVELDPADYLAVTASYSASYLPQPIRASMRITPQSPIEFSYPVPPGESAGQATLSVMGVVGGQMVTTSAIPLQQADEAVYFLVDGSRVQSVARNVVLSESDALAERLRSGSGRPIVSDRGPTAEDTGDLDIETDVVLIPQPTDVTCWAASLAMVVSARDQSSTDPARIAAVAGMDVNTGYGWDAIRRAVQAWDLVEEGPQSAMPDEVARWLEAWGPIWVVEIGAPYHAVVLSGIHGDGTPEGTYVTVYNPWPPGVGAIETKWFTDFENEFGLGAGAGAAMVHAARP
jgi:hypothetical protein